MTDKELVSVFQNQLARMSRQQRRELEISAEAALNAQARADQDSFIAKLITRFKTTFGKEYSLKQRRRTI